MNEQDRWLQKSHGSDRDLDLQDAWQLRSNAAGSHFPKDTDLSVHSEADLDWVAAELNDRPCKRLAFEKPIEAIGKLVLQ